MLHRAGLKGGPMRRGISMEEVKQHRTQEDAWLVYNGKARASYCKNRAVLWGKVSTPLLPGKCRMNEGVGPRLTQCSGELL